jgi:hypothetical protein
VDAAGIEPAASPLQGERSTTDLRARWARRRALADFNDSSQLLAARTDLGACFTPSTLLPELSELEAKRKVLFRVGGDPSAGSPTDTLLRLNPPCRAQV